ncbi:MAG: YhdH/YhfP family quinone oxidoreductase [Anaerolineae bacterium]|nr:YhdH/YhfP family quinone oxidoreductase [Anaerolineae bacterium]
MAAQMTFAALVVTLDAEGSAHASVQTRTLDDLPTHDTLIRVRYSSLNYKDALSASGHRGVTRHYPHTPGIDAAGEVVSTTSAELALGQPVIVSGYDLGMNTPGGWGMFVRVPAAWVMPLPSGLTLFESMALGTAGFTAALAVQQLQRHGVAPEAGEVLVTGASGGVGSIAVALLAQLGYRVVAATGKPSLGAWLQRLGAAEVLPREAVDDRSDRPLLKGRWAGVVDTVGGNILASAIRSTRRGGCVVACGLAQSPNLSLTVYPFILRGITLQGVDSAEAPMSLRCELWARLATEWKPHLLSEIVTAVATLEQLPAYVDAMLRGETHGRVVVQLP